MSKFDVAIRVRLALPSLPNFIRRDDGQIDGPVYDIADIDDEILRELGRQWTEALIERARKRREPKP